MSKFIHKLEQKLHLHHDAPEAQQGVPGTTATTTTTTQSASTLSPTTGVPYGTGVSTTPTSAVSGTGAPVGGTLTTATTVTGPTMTPLKTPPTGPTTEPVTPGLQQGGAIGGGMSTGWDQINLAEVKTLQQCDRTVQMQNGRTEIITLGGVPLAVSYLQPGWHFAEHGAPVAGTLLCQKRHAFFVVRGTMRALTTEGKEIFFGPNTFGSLLPGHDAWVQGNEEVMVFDWAGELEACKKGAVGEVQGQKVAPTVQ